MTVERRTRSIADRLFDPKWAPPGLRWQQRLPIADNRLKRWLAAYSQRHKILGAMIASTFYVVVVVGVLALVTGLGHPTFWLILGASVWLVMSALNYWFNCWRTRGSKAE